MLLLAGPGVVIVAIFEAIAFYWILDYKVDIFNKNIVLSMTDLHSVIQFLFGAILSATDPVAVVSLLKVFIL